MLDRHAIAAAMAFSILLLTGPALAGERGHSHGDSSGQGNGHGSLREIPAGQFAPGLSLEAIADPADGYNLHLVVENFAFSPERTGIANDAVEGHAHLYVNGTKIGRVYGSWAHLPAKLLSPGENEIKISLNDNTHRAWAHHGSPIEASLTLRGLREIVVKLDGEAAPVIEIAHGEWVRLMIHGAGDGQLHFHGYDVEIQAHADKPVMLDLSADHRGRFPVMTHFHDQLLGDQEKALFYIDIRSR